MELISNDDDTVVIAFSQKEFSNLFIISFAAFQEYGVFDEEIIQLEEEEVYEFHQQIGRIFNKV